MTKRLLGPVWTPSTMAYEARCPDCGKLAFFVTAEAVIQQRGNVKVPVLVAHTCPGEEEVNGL